MAISIVRSRSQAPAASILASRSACSGAELLVVGVGVGPAGHDLVVLGRAAPATSADAVHHVAVHVLGRVELRLLLEHADGEAGGEAGLAGEAVVDARP